MGQGESKEKQFLIYIIKHTLKKTGNENIGKDMPLKTSSIWNVLIQALADDKEPCVLQSPLIPLFMNVLLHCYLIQDLRKRQKSIIILIGHPCNKSLYITTWAMYKESMGFAAAKIRPTSKVNYWEKKELICKMPVGIEKLDYPPSWFLLLHL